jgi:hypothetical protein
MSKHIFTSEATFMRKPKAEITKSTDSSEFNSEYHSKSSDQGKSPG